MRIQYKAIDSKERLWNHQYGSMWANEAYETGRTKIPEGRVLRHDRDISWYKFEDN